MMKLFEDGLCGMVYCESYHHIDLPKLIGK